VWTQAKRLRVKSGDTEAERLELYADLEIVWEAKQRVKAEIHAKNVKRFMCWRHPTAAERLTVLASTGTIVRLAHSPVVVLSIPNNSLFR
jgi:hypothetical protein